MAYLIDGNNFLGHTVPAAHRDPQHRYELAQKLLIFQRLTRSRVILVFDGAPDPYLSDERLQSKRFTVLFPPRGAAADTIIRELLESLTDLRRFFLVSSDRELKSFGRSRGAAVLTCGEFDGMLKEVLKKNKALRELTKTAENPSPLEVRLWTDVFTKK
jgi:predicted RNA-binding protein with PIN domain